MENNMKHCDETFNTNFKNEFQNSTCCSHIGELKQLRENIFKLLCFNIPELKNGFTREDIHTAKVDYVLDRLVNKKN